jgi:outer membrane lipoprotein-sorting protein
MVVPAFWTRQRCSILSLALLVGACLPARLDSQESAVREAPYVREAPSEGTLQPARTDVTAERIFAELMRRNELRNAALRSYSAVRSYAVTDPKGKVHAQEVVQVAYSAPDTKSFVTISEKGSALVRRLVLHRLMESESETASGKKRHDSTISTANYTFTLLGEQDLGANHCFVVQATPNRSDKYLFDGKVWIDAEDYAIVQISGHPSKKLSFWVDKADFVRRYQKIGEFWLPLKDETSVHVRLYGTKILTIDHERYTINEAQSGPAQQGRESTQ